MSNESESERRAPGATRFPFEGLVEIGTSLGPAFEAQAVDVSGDGMHLRTAYLPELGQPVTCRFDAGATGTVQAAGEVVWREEAGKGGECGIRFTDLDAESEGALRGMLEQPAQGPSRVRLHIDGLGVAMKAKVRDSSRTKVTVGNDLGFLQVGKHLELEDAETGEKRPAHIARVELEVDPETQIPRLVVGLRYEDEEISEPQAMDATASHKDSTPEPSVLDAADDEVLAADEPSVDEESQSMKSSFARNAAKVTPAILALAKRAKVTAAMVWAKRKTNAAAAIEDNAPRRTTAAPPGGALHTAGRKVVRSETVAPIVGLSRLALKLDTKRKVAIGAAAGLTVAILFAALHHKPAQPPQVADVASATSAVAALPPAPTVDPMLAQVPPPPPPTLTMPTVVEDTPPPVAHKKLHVAPFSNGSVSHGTVLRLRMDGPIEKINGAAQPTGFTVSIPGRKSIEPAGPLAARDSRIGSIKVSNDGAGAELDVNFKDGVPNYVVRARGEVLEVVLAAQGNVGGTPQAKATPPKPASVTAPASSPKKKPTAPHKKK